MSAELGALAALMPKLPLRQDAPPYANDVRAADGSYIAEMNRADIAAAFVAAVNAVPVLLERIKQLEAQLTKETTHV